MNEKKEMEIVVSADTTKAKTSLQRLADFFDSRFKDEESTKLDIDTAEARAKLVQVNNDIKWLKSEIKDIDPSSKQFGLWAEELERAETEASKLRDVLKETNVETKKVEVDMSDGLEKASKKSRKFVLSLFSIRSAWAFISKASRTYLSENEDTANKVSGLWSYFGNVFGAVIERVVNWLQYGIAYINVFLKALTGIDFLAKSIQKSTAKTNKELKKTVSSMDEIVNLDIDKGTGADIGAGLQGINDLELNPKIVKAMETLGNVLKTVWEWAKKAWDFLEEHFGTVGATAILGGTALMIGSAAKGVGLAGISGILKTIGVLTASAFAIKFIYEGITGRDLVQDLKDIVQGYKDVRDAKKMNEEANKKLHELDLKLIEAYNKEIERLEKENSTLDQNSQKYQENRARIEEIKTKLNELNGTKASTTIEINADDRKAKNVLGQFWNEIKRSGLQIWDSFQGLFSGKYKYATGGFPEEGQMFIANERGPELVGNIGGSTAVVNNAQIVESVSQGVANAVAGVLGSQRTTDKTATYLYINGSEFAKAVYGDMQTETQRRNANASIRRV